MFERPHHQRIAHVLSALNGETLLQHGCLFGGGTCIALRYGEYRESVDIDFLVSDAAGYRELRQLLTGPEGLGPITHTHAPPLVVLREIRASRVHMALVFDEYGHFEGIITPGDVLEAIIGAFQEEEEDEPPIVTRADGSWLVAGWMQEGLARWALCFDMERFHL
mgnify:CR=1 FL=1